MNKTSVFGNKWEFLESETSKAMAYNQKLGLSLPLSQILAANNLLNLENVMEFLNPSIRAQMPNPFKSLMDVGLAVTRIIKAIENKQKIVIFGDYDVDGATSCAILKKFFQMLATPSAIYIPDRVKEGYGPNTNALLELRKKGVDLVITVDCGTVAFEPLQKANEAGLEIIVIDHHLGVKQKPESIAVINPNRWDETSPLTYLCGAGVSFMLVVALNMTLKLNKFYEKNQIKEPNLLSLLDLVALGTVCDVMPLVGLNRAFVKTGLEVLKAKTNIGLKMLMGVAGQESEITEYTLGFIIGPRINAGGRIGRADMGATLLSSNNEEEALNIALELNELNAKRREIEGDSLELAIQKVEGGRLYENNIIFVEDYSFHQGIIGILAGRLKERYNKPVAVFSCLEGYMKASLRSIPSIDLGSLIHKANAKGLLIAGGGHAMAGGLSVLNENYAKLHELFEEEIKSGNFTQQKTVYAAGILTLNSLNLGLVDEVLKLRPFGNANPKPLFCLKDLAVVKVDVLKEKHVSLLLKDEISNKTTKAMFFKAHELGILPNLTKLLGKKIDVLTEVEVNNWNGSSNIFLNLVDLAF